MEREKNSFQSTFKVFSLVPNFYKKGGDKNGREEEGRDSFSC